MKKLAWPIVGVIVMAILTTVQDALTDQHIDAQEWILVLLGAVMAFNVWATANLPQYERMKTYMSAAIAVFSALHVFIVGGVDIAELINLAVIALAALGVSVTKQPLTTVVNGRTVTPNDANGPPRTTTRLL